MFFAQNPSNASDLAAAIVNALHGYSGYLNPANTGIAVAKLDVTWVMENYDDHFNLTQILLDIRAYVPA